MKKLWENLWNSLRRHDRFLVIELAPREVRLTRLAVNFEKKEISLSPAYTRAIVEEDGHIGVMEEIRRLIKKNRFDRSHVLISLDPRFGSTFYEPVILMRGQPRQEVDESDLDNRVAQGLWRLCNRVRRRAAEKMAVEELDVILAEVAVRRAKLDGHRVVNPAGFPARIIELGFAATFVIRPLFECIRKYFSPEYLRFVGERGVIAADLLERAGYASSFAVIEIFDEETHVMVAKGARIGFESTVKWGRTDLIRAIQESFEVSFPVAQKMFDLYSVRQASPQMLHALERVLFSRAANFGYALAKIKARLDVKEAYISSSFTPPSFLWGSEFRACAGRLRVLPLDALAIVRELGFEWKLENKSTQGAFSAIAPFLSFYFLPHDDKMTKMAQRHARWLTNEERTSYV